MPRPAGAPAPRRRRAPARPERRAPPAARPTRRALREATSLRHLVVRALASCVLEVVQVGAAGGVAEAAPRSGARAQPTASAPPSRVRVDAVAGQGAGERQRLADLARRRRPPPPSPVTLACTAASSSAWSIQAPPPSPRRARAREQRREHRRRRALHAPDDVGDRDRRRRRRGGQRAGDRLVGEVVPGARRVRPVLPPAGERADHQPRVALAQLLRRQAEARQRAGAEALEQHVGAREQAAQRLHRRRLLEVERHALDAGEQQRRERALAARPAAPRRAPGRPRAAPRP